MTQKLTDSLLNSLAKLLRDWITADYNFINQILNDVFKINSPQMGGDVKGFSPSGLITTHPAGFEGGNIWLMVSAISDNAIVPIAGLILLIVLVTDLIQAITAGNQFENTGVGVFVKWIVKAIIGIILVSNAFNIVGYSFQFGVIAGAAGLEKLTDFSGTFSIKLDDKIWDKDKIGELLIMTVLSFLTLLVIVALLVAIIITLAGRIIEIFMYLSVAPIATATYMNSEWRSMGNNWLKGIFALAFQAFFIVVAIAIFTALFGGVLSSINNGVDDTNKMDIIFQMLVLLGYSGALVFTIMRSGSISKSIFGAS